jgi:hypothetical protein
MFLNQCESLLNYPQKTKSSKKKEAEVRDTGNPDTGRTNGNILFKLSTKNVQSKSWRLFFSAKVTDTCFKCLSRHTAPQNKIFLLKKKKRQILGWELNVN